MADKANVAVVGYGLAGNYFHSYPISIAEGLNLYGVMARQAEVREQAEADWGVKTLATFDEMLADDTRCAGDSRRAGRAGRPHNGVGWRRGDVSQPSGSAAHYEKADLIFHELYLQLCGSFQKIARLLPDHPCRNRVFL